ncbi:hypothetical protein [Sphingobacterium daejeonense]|uniref:hypothetical protein n=1 Tax=Sphingobacterium daejeonense TaxID=371142 RepID=UPI0010FCE8BC|nr:hypothetical protein [Sphingobacterium daejeonense]
MNMKKISVAGSSDSSPTIPKVEPTPVNSHFIESGRMGFSGKDNEHGPNFIRKALDKVRPVLLEKGFKGLKLRNILTCTGFSKSKFFNYFGNVMGFYENPSAPRV